MPAAWRGSASLLPVSAAMLDFSLGERAKPSRTGSKFRPPCRAVGDRRLHPEAAAKRGMPPATVNRPPGGNQEFDLNEHRPTTFSSSVIYPCSERCMLLHFFSPYSSFPNAPTPRRHPLHSPHASNRSLLSPTRPLRRRVLGRRRAFAGSWLQQTPVITGGSPESVRPVRPRPGRVRAAIRGRRVRPQKTQHSWAFIAEGLTGSSGTTTSQPGPIMTSCGRNVLCRPHGPFPYRKFTSAAHKRTDPL